MKKGGVVIIGPAWHSCGTHQCFKAQIRAISALGLDTYFLAVCPVMNVIGDGDGWWDWYLRMTPDILATERGEAKLLNVSKWRPEMILGKLRCRGRTAMFWRTMPARLAHLPDSLGAFVRSHDIRNIVCNHYFNLPVAKKIKKMARGAKVVFETHDIQSRHMIQSDPTHPLTGAPGDYDSYFRDEVRCLGGADIFVHLNEEEFDIFKREVPAKEHCLIYPSVPRPPPPLETLPDIDFVIIASANPPNHRSLCWFLDEVWDDELNASASLRIVGNIDYMFMHPTEDERYRRFGDIFVGRVEDVAEWYHRARTIVAPVIDGQGLAIKTVEALAFGRPFLFSPLAVRGFADHPAAQGLTGLCKTAEEFKAALKQRLTASAAATESFVREIDAEAMQVYERLFAPQMYNAKYGALFGASPSTKGELAKPPFFFTPTRPKHSSESN